MNDSPKTFENSAIRTVWNEQEEEWYFSVVDVVGVLTEQVSPRSASTYWAVLKKRLVEEGAGQLLTNCKQLKMKSADGKMRLTDVANTEQLLRIIQSVPSKKAEPFKIWLAEVGRERIEETIDPEQTIDRALETYVKKGYSREWINQRLQAIQVRKELTDEWENLRDNMTTTEIILNMLAETATKNISQTEKPESFEDNKSAARRGGRIAGNARKELEAEIGHSVISDKSAPEINSVVTNLIETVAKDDKNE